MGDLGAAQLAGQSQPVLCGLADRSSFADPALALDPFEQRQALDPIHHDQRIPAAVRGADGRFAVLEID